MTLPPQAIAESFNTYYQPEGTSVGRSANLEDLFEYVEKLALEDNGSLTSFLKMLSPEALMLCALQDNDSIYSDIAEQLGVDSLAELLSCLSSNKIAKKQLIAIAKICEENKRLVEAGVAALVRYRLLDLERNQINYLSKVWAGLKSTRYSYFLIFCPEAHPEFKELVNVKLQKNFPEALNLFFVGTDEGIGFEYDKYSIYMKATIVRMVVFYHAWAKKDACMNAWISYIEEQNFNIKHNGSPKGFNKDTLSLALVLRELSDKLV